MTVTTNTHNFQACWGPVFGTILVQFLAACFGLAQAGPGWPWLVRAALLLARAGPGSPKMPKAGAWAGPGWPGLVRAAPQTTIFS